MRAVFNIATPLYLMEILNNYFQNRKVIYIYIRRDGGIPQGSVLGLLL